MTAKAVIQTRNPLDSPGYFPVIEQESSKGINLGGPLSS